MSSIAWGLCLGIGIVLVASVFFGVPWSSPRHPEWYQRWSDRITRAGLTQWTPMSVTAVSVLLSALAYVVALQWTQTMSISAIGAAAVVPLVNAGISARARRRESQLRVLWPEVIDSMVSGVRAGASLVDLFIDLETSAPVELRPYFAEFAREYRASGRFDTALSYMKRRMADPVADRIVEALRLAREVGGSDLSLILRDLAVMLRDEARIRGEIQARQSWTVNAARLGVASPWLVLLMISRQPQAAKAYSTPEGVFILVLGGALSVLAYFIMQRLGRLSMEGRALR